MPIQLVSERLGLSTAPGLLGPVQATWSADEEQLGCERAGLVQWLLGAEL